MTSINTNNFIHNRVNSNTNNNVNNTKPSFGAQEPKRSEGMSSDAAESLKAQKIGQQTIPQIKESDINFEVTLCGHGLVKNNTRDINDYRITMTNRYGFDWSRNFNKPTLIYNGNGDEKRNGPTTALVIPLHPETKGFRGSDHATLVINGIISKALICELTEHLGKIGLLNQEPIFNCKYYINSLTPKEFLNRYEGIIKKEIVKFFKQKEAELAQAQNQAQAQEQTKTSTTAEKTSKTETKTNKQKINSTHINIANIGGKQNINNARTVENYVRYFLENNREFTVVHDQYATNGKETDVTAILLPSKKNPMDCITITIDTKLDKETCKNLINYLVKQKITNVDNPDFRKTIVEYLNNL